MTDRLVLALDTATVVNVGLARGGQVLAVGTVADRMAHAEQLMPLVADVLARAGVRVADLDQIVVGLGPGPFTGLRVGVVTAQILATVTGVGAARRLQPRRPGRRARGHRPGRGVRRRHRRPAPGGLLGPLRRGRHPADRAGRRPAGRGAAAAHRRPGRRPLPRPADRRARAAPPRSRRDGRPRTGPARRRAGAALPPPAGRHRAQPAEVGARRTGSLDGRRHQPAARPPGRPGRDHGPGADGLPRARAVERAQLAGRAGRGQPPGAASPGPHQAGRGRSPGA